VGAWSWSVEFAERVDLSMLIASFINLKCGDIGGKHRQRLFRYEYVRDGREVSVGDKGRSRRLQL